MQATAQRKVESWLIREEDMGCDRGKRGDKAMRKQPGFSLTSAHQGSNALDSDFERETLRTPIFPFDGGHISGFDTGFVQLALS